MLDRDLILQTDFFQPAVIFVLERELEWLFKNIDRALESCREALIAKNIGSVEGETKILWIQMLKHPFIKFHPFPNYNSVVEMCLKFNRLLQQEVKKSCYALTIDLDIEFSMENFDSFGNLTFGGKVKFWRYINAEFMKFDKSTHNHKSIQQDVEDNSRNNELSTGRSSCSEPNLIPPHCLSRNWLVSRRNRNISTPKTTEKDIWGKASCMANQWHKHLKFR